jgi:hypothetical protein
MRTGAADDDKGAAVAVASAVEASAAAAEPCGGDEGACNAEGAAPPAAAIACKDALAAQQLASGARLPVCFAQKESALVFGCLY